MASTKHSAFIAVVQQVLHNPYSKHVIPLLKQLMARIIIYGTRTMLPDIAESESDLTYYLCVQ